MKRLVLCILLAVCVILFAGAAEILFPDAHDRVYHHQEAADAQWCESVPEGDFCTHLPLVVISTGGQQLSYTEEVLASLSVTDNQGGHNHLSGTPTLQTDMLFKLRGNSSSQFDKKQYRLTFVDTEGYLPGTTDLQTLPHVSHEVMGMPQESEWILNGPFLDRTLVRNYLMYNLSGEIMDWAPNVRFCEVILDGDYLGVYLMLETVKVDENRINISSANPNQISTSYMIERERIGDTNYPLDNFGSYANRTHNEVGVVYPGPNSGRTEAHMEYVRQDVSILDRRLYSIDYDHQKRGYKALIDVQSFVDYYIINEFSLNVDAGGLSTYMYKDAGGRYVMGPVWDFNNCFDNYEYYVEHDDFYLFEKSWYKMLMKDEEFVDQIITRYAQLRQGVLEEEKLLKTVDDTVAFLGPALQRNEARWALSYETDWLTNVDMGGDPLDFERNPETYEEALTYLKEMICKRGQFMDEYVRVLQQFCAESKVKQWN